MATNPTIRHYDELNDQSLYESIVTESISIYGVDAYYIPRDSVNIDELFGEDTLSAFKKLRTIECYVEDTSGFGGAGDLISKFGLEVKDTMNFVISKRRFREIFGHYYDIDRPKEGDLLYFPLSKGFFEVTFVEHEAPFYQLGKNYTFRLNTELFRYSQEKIQTNNDVIDELQTTLENDNSVANEPYANNNEIESEADDVLDFTEQNVFGNP